VKLCKNSQLPLGMQCNGVAMGCVMRC